MKAVPQFGLQEPGADYADRPAAFGLAFRDGLLAVVRIAKNGHAPYLDLPGGALDDGETHAQAMEREFAEETGLIVRAGREIGRADQFMAKTDGRRVNNRAVFLEVRVEGEDAERKVEPDHSLEFVDAVEALRTLRHEAHAWAVAAWLRSSAQG